MMRSGAPKFAGRPTAKFTPSGRAAWTCDAGSGLRYFDSEDDAREFLERCDLADLLGASAV